MKTLLPYFIFDDFCSTREEVSSIPPIDYNFTFVRGCDAHGCFVGARCCAKINEKTRDCDSEACRNCSYIDCELFAKSANAHAFSYRWGYNPFRNQCNLCNKSAPMYGQDDPWHVLDWGLYIRSHVATGKFIVLWLYTM